MTYTQRSDLVSLRPGEMIQTNFILAYSELIHQRSVQVSLSHHGGHQCPDW